MIDIEDKNHAPSVRELCEYVDNPLFDELCRTLDREYSAVQCVEYSGDKAFLGWNLKLKKAGRTLCTLYPRRGKFPVLLVVGPREKERIEELLPSMSEEFRAVYDATPEGMGQRWLMYELASYGGLYDDTLTVIQVRRRSRPVPRAKK